MEDEGLLLSEEVLTMAYISVMGIDADRAALHFNVLEGLGILVVLDDVTVVSGEARVISRFKNRCIVTEMAAD